MEHPKDNQKEPRKPGDAEERHETTEANEEMKEEFEEGDEKPVLPANRVGGLRGNPS